MRATKGGVSFGHRQTPWFVGVRDSVDALARRSPSRFAILVFTGLILVFTLLFSLPVASSARTLTPLHDALFTAVSVICVTGLSTVDMATHWSAFGNILVVVGVNIGGVGVLTLASLMGMVISRRLGLRAKLMAASDTNPSRIHAGPVNEGQTVRLGEVGNLLLTVAISALAIELVVAALLLPRILASGAALGEAIWHSVYYAAMAFTNTGFNPNVGGLAPFANDEWFLGALMLGVFLGSLGFPVIYALSRGWRTPRRWSVHVKLTLFTTIALLVAGVVIYIVLEFDNPKTFGSLGVGDTVFQSLFMSVMTRSGGFATINVSDLHGSSLLASDMLMFIGGGSASTAGGIKVTTLAVLFLAAFAEASGRSEMEAFGRRIPSDILRLAVSVVLWGATTVAVASILILQISKAPFDLVLFDVISAFATCGLSTGLTADLPPAGVYVLAATMFMGRVGTVTLAAALAASQSRQLFRRPEERPIVG
ncbi:trk system potassium uptake protein TrkH [Cryobacterium sp. MP_M5]|uniref:TrkH family potassium uptake protein n=1 Tax=unclassified Cryobacterium TaxID=2649013 RepID=UPI0018C91462|nr:MULTISPECIES: potassium transporter TrkG [unclassified Cryobacterium]MBG6056692.1 Trk-type K+ transport system membrane component [Cryobacterium sp. MP_M3]MEC5176364.1 trk system potassium uptake protein TrkH [Cryobacterium sp. MP_M5]